MLVHLRSPTVRGKAL